MNSGSKLDISKSSLLSLKAELARKHEEASKAKAQSQGNYIKPLGKPSKNSIFSRSNIGVEQRQSNDDLPELTSDEESKIKRSRSILEEKAKIYDSLSEQRSHDDNSSYLVDFAQKPSIVNHHERDKALHEEEENPRKREEEEEEERRRREKEEEEEEARRADSDEYDAPSDPEDDWVDFTDSLGRTRRCLRRDMSRFRELDDRLLKSLESKNSSEDKSPPHLHSGPLPPGGFPAGCAGPDLLSDDMRREQQRLKWEEEEERLLSKSDIHYQDVLFDEARSHGVGYFPFARDESTRRSQQDDLRKLRKETVAKQKATLTQREKRQQMMRARLRAAHNRKRAREGLPPLGEDDELPGENKEAEEESVDFVEPAPTPVPTVQKAKGPKPKPSPAVRPWDIGKEGVPVMTQSEWNDQQRAERKREFAPPSFYEDRQGDRRGGGGHDTHTTSERRRSQLRRKRKATDDHDNDDDDDDGDIGPKPPPPRPSEAPPGPPGPPPPPGFGPGAWMRVPPPLASFMPPVHLPPPSMVMPSWPPQPVPPPPFPADQVADDPRGGLFFTSKKATKRDWRTAQGEVRLPMEEEEDLRPPGVSDSPPRRPAPPAPRDYNKKGGSDSGRKGAEIAPPATLEYYGPSDAAADRSRRTAAVGQGTSSGDGSDLGASISAGLRFLRQQAEDKERKRTDKGWADFV